MVEYGGAWVPRHAGLEVEAARLSGWFPYEESAEGYRVPMDFAMAALRVAERERLFVATLLARLARPDADVLLAELGVSDLGTRTTRLCAAATLIARGAPATADEAAAVAAVDSVKARDGLTVGYVEGSAGRRYRLQSADGSFELVPRELAAGGGATFAAPVVWQTAAAPEAKPARSLPTVPVGAVVTFASARAADMAFGELEFRRLVQRRLDERRAAVVPECSATRARDVLVKLGFHVDGEEVG